MSLKIYFLTLDLLLMSLFSHISYLFLLGYLPFACQYLRALHFVKENMWISKVCYVKHVYMKVSQYGSLGKNFFAEEEEITKFLAKL